MVAKRSSNKSSIKKSGSFIVMETKYSLALVLFNLVIQEKQFDQERGQETK